MKNNYYISGKLGDIIYALYFIKSQGGGNIYLPFGNENSPFSLLADFLKMQPYINTVVGVPSGFSNNPQVRADLKLINLDVFRLHASTDKLIIQSFFDAFSKKIESQGLQYEWLFFSDNKLGISFDIPPFNYAVINVTDRYRNHAVNWSKIYNEIEDVYSKLVFVGLRHEYEAFVKMYKIPNSLEYIETKNIAEVAYIVKKATSVYCNQSLVLTLAQGFDKNIFLEKEPLSSNTYWEKPNVELL